MEVWVSSKMKVGCKMKNFLMIVGLGLMISCSKGGGGSTVSATPGAPTPPTSPSGGTCKSINSVWTSTTDFERHDFTSVLTTYSAYTYKGYNNVTCPSNAQNAKLYASGAVALGAGFEYTIEYQLIVDPPAIGCGYWKDGAIHHGSAIIHLGCNTLRMCQGITFGCKDFN